MNEELWIEWTADSVPPGIPGDEFVVIFNGDTRGIAHWDVSGAPEHEDFYWWSKEVRDGARVTHYLPRRLPALPNNQDSVR